MVRTLTRSLLALFLLPLLAASVLPADPAPKKDAGPDLSGFRTVETAVTTRISRAAPSAAPSAPGYLGVQAEADARGKLVVADVEADSPAAKAGVQAGDVLVRVAGEKMSTAEALREVVQSKAPGHAVKVSLLRKDKPQELTVTLGATSRPMTPGTGQRATLGVQLAEATEGGDGLPVEGVTSGMPAATAGIKVGDLLVKIDDTPLNRLRKLSEVMNEKKPGDAVTVTFRRDGKDQDLKLVLAAGAGREGRPGNWDDRNLAIWRKDVYRLAVVGIEYPDVKHNDKITKKDWEESFFSRKTYTGKSSVTGQPVHGSLNDYYQEQSYGNLRVEGKMFDWVEASKKRADYGLSTQGPAKTALLVEALDLLQKRDGKEALKDFDGVFFLYAGDRVQTNRGSLYWPHRASVTHQGQRWPYFIVNEGGQRMTNISVCCHEFGHLLGLPDLYARPENPGSEGLGVWCAMSNQIGSGRPQHFCAWSKEQLGWLKPVVIDPTVKQKLILSPVEDSPKECFKVLVRADGSEYLLLENRKKKGFDTELPAEGLLVWRVVNNKPILEESHGVEGPTGPRVFPEAVPFPSPANNAFTPYTTPSSRSQLGGGLPVHITNIRRLADGRITFYVGYEYQ